MFVTVFIQFIVFSFRKLLGITMVLKGEKIQYSVHLVMPETHKVLKLWLKYIYKADK